MLIVEVSEADAVKVLTAFSEGALASLGILSVEEVSRDLKARLGWTDTVIQNDRSGNSR